MAGRAGPWQANFSAGELSPHMLGRLDLKYYATGASRAENVEIIPQGGFRARAGLRHIGTARPDAARIIPFTASNGESYVLAFAPGEIEIWRDGVAIALDLVAAPYGVEEIGALTFAQALDTLLIFHPDHAPRRLRIFGATTWEMDLAPLRSIPNHDYGGAYANGVAAAWELEFVGLEQGSTPDPEVPGSGGAGTRFTLSVSGEETRTMAFSGLAALAALVKTELEALPNVEPGLTVEPAGDKLRITFSGAANLGDWPALSGRVVNKDDAAVLAYRTVAGVEPGEPVMSEARGWPACGLFWQQRLLLCGLNSLPNAILASETGDYWNFDTRISAASGPMLLPLDLEGGERIERLAALRNLLILTNEGEYWLTDRGFDKSAAPNIAPATKYGLAPGSSVAMSEGGALFIGANRSGIYEARYAEADAAYKVASISLLATHLVSGVRDLAIRRPIGETDAALLLLLLESGDAVLASLLREQDVTAFTRLSTDGRILSAAADGDDKLWLLVERQAGAARTRRLEIYDPAALLDGEIRATCDLSGLVYGLDAHEGATVWALADGDVFGPFAVVEGEVRLPEVAVDVRVGRWSRPRVVTVPLSPEVAQGVALHRRRRIHSVHADLLDTTALAIAANGGAPYEAALRRYGEATAHTPTLATAPPQTVTMRGFPGFSEAPTVEITQARPGRLTLRRLTLETS